jgi:hypothetical protein
MKKMSYDFSSRCHLFSMWIVPQASTRLEYRTTPVTDEIAVGILGRARRTLLERQHRDNHLQQSLHE